MSNSFTMIASFSKLIMSSYWQMQQAPCIFQTNKHRYLKQILLFDFYTVVSLS